MNEIINFGEKKRVKIIMLKGEKGDKGEDGSSGDYSALTNKPKINDVELSGNKTASDLGLVSETEFEQSQTVTDTSIDRIKESFATVEPSSESAHAYAVGQYLVYNGYLYKTLQAISIGDTLNDTAPSGNIALVTVADELNAIQSDVADAQTDIGTLQTNVGTLQTDMATAQGDITVIENEILPIGETISGTASSDLSMRNGNFTEIASIQLSKGSYMIDGYVLMPATYTADIGLAYSMTEASVSESFSQATQDSRTTRKRLCRPIVMNADGTMKLYCITYGSGVVASSAGISAMRIK